MSALHNFFEYFFGLVIATFDCATLTRECFDAPESYFIFSAFVIVSTLLSSPAPPKVCPDITDERGGKRRTDKRSPQQQQKIEDCVLSFFFMGWAKRIDPLWYVVGIQRPSRRQIAPTITVGCRTIFQSFCAFPQRKTLHKTKQKDSMAKHIYLLS